MATVTIGTASTTTLVGVLFQPSGGGNAAFGTGIIPVAADYATIDNNILDDLNPAHPNFGANVGLARSGMLFVPNRGTLLVRPGDYIAYDPQTGWPILLSGRAAGAAGWVHT